MSHFTLADDKKLQFLSVLDSFREHLKMVSIYVKNEEKEFIAFNYLTMAHSDFNYMKILYYNHLLYFDKVEELFNAYKLFKAEIEFIITCIGRKDYDDVIPLKNNCVKLIKAVEDHYTKTKKVSV